MAGDGETFDVERLLEKKVERDGRILYKVRWKNFGPKDDTWVRNIAVMWPFKGNALFRFVVLPRNRFPT